jgi:hypothetical protein
MEAIAVSPEGCAVIDADECVECGVCYRAAACPTDAIVEEVHPWPRSVRATFSNPLFEHKETRIPGRGTEEMKTNDVTGRFRRGEVGVAVELGRPGSGARFHQVQQVTHAMAGLGIRLEAANPVTHLLIDPERGLIHPDVLGEKVLSAIVEFTIPTRRLQEVLTELRSLGDRIETVFSVGVACRVESDGSVPSHGVLQELGLTPAVNGKSNVGLGRPLYEEAR